MSAQKFVYSFLYLLGLEDQFSPTEDVDSLPFESPRRGRKRLFSEASITMTSNHLDTLADPGGAQGARAPFRQTLLNFLRIECQVCMSKDGHRDV